MGGEDPIGHKRLKTLANRAYYAWAHWYAAPGGEGPEFEALDKVMAVLGDELRDQGALRKVARGRK